MAIELEKVLFKLVNTKRRAIDTQVSEILKKGTVVGSRNTIIYLIFAESLKKELPLSLYVGKTTNTLLKRYKQHISSIRRCASGKIQWNLKYRWMYSVIKSGSDLRVIELNKVPKLLGYEFEKEWIQYFQENGFNMINKKNSYYYKHKIYTV